VTRTKWWYVLAGVAVLNVVWSLAGVLSGETLGVGPASLWVLFGGSLLLLTPLFYLALYRETTTARDRHTPWNPDSRLWLGGGVIISVIGAVLFLNPLTHYVAGLYLVRRFQRGRPTAASK
jgi:hypothetical protein